MTAQSKQSLDLFYWNTEDSNKSYLRVWKPENVDDRNFSIHIVDVVASLKFASRTNFYFDKVDKTLIYYQRNFRKRIHIL